MRYYDFKNEQKKKADEFTNGLRMFFAFSNEQFEEGLKKINHQEGEKLTRFGGGAFIISSDFPALETFFENQVNELILARQDENFAVDMFLYELANHEFGYTNSVEDTLEALDIDDEDFKKEPHLRKCLKVAIKEYWETFEG